MAAPLSGVGQQQQVPLSQTFQPGGSDQTREIRQRNQEPRENEVQARSAASAQSQSTSHDTTKSDFQKNLNAINTSEQSSSSGRGSVVDIVV